VSSPPPPRAVRSRWTGRLSLLVVLLLLAAVPLLAGAADDGAGRSSGDAEATAPTVASDGRATRTGSRNGRPLGRGGPVGSHERAVPAARTDRLASPSGTPVAAADDGATLATLTVHRATPATTRPLASHGRLLVRAPSVAPVVAGYHEAGNRHGLELAPVGELLAHRNTTRVDAPGDDPDGTPYLILSSRGQAAPATSAVDVVMRDDDPVLAPVSGVVRDVRSYHLYGQHLDHRVEIVPRAAPHLRVVLIHLDDVQVVEGDRVRVGQSVLATSAMRFPFASQIDRDTEPDRWPHVHLEVQPVGAPRPGDQLEAADDAGDAEPTDDG
jgi:biotin carboxyl carrier protein